MKKELLREAIEQLDDGLIQEAFSGRRKKPVWRRFAALAACLVLVAGTAAVWNLYGAKNSDQNYSYQNARMESPHKPAAGNTAGDTAPENALESETGREGQKMNQFGYQVGAQLLADSGQNVLFSPASLYYALAMTAEGAAGETQEQLLQLLGAEDPQSLAELCREMYQRQSVDEENSKLKIANSIWVDASLGKLKKEYTNLIASSFYGSVFSVDFTDPAARRQIGEWIAQQTNGLVEYTPSEGVQVMSLINTVYFKDRWTVKFRENKTQEDDFVLEDGQKVRHEFMNGSVPGTVYEGEGYTRGVLEMERGSMVFVLPEEGSSVQELAASAQKLSEAFTGGKEQAGYIQWHLPKFSFDASMQLSDTLQSLGVKLAFGPEADFTKMTDSVEGLFISSVTQNTHIALNEYGAEAAAYTEVAMARGAMPPGREFEMNLNRPFLYGILDEEGNLIFIGTCMNPGE